MRHVTVAVLVAVAAVAAASGAGAAAPIPRCHTVELVAQLKRGSPGAGQRYATVLLRNRSQHRCRVYGYIGAQLIGAGHRRLPTNVVRDRTRTPRRVVLASGAGAQALLHWGAIPGPGEPQARPCEPAPRFIEITPPDETRYLVVRWPFGPVCEHGRIDVRPLRS